MRTRHLGAVVLLCCACARPQPEAKAPTRVKDSVPEKAAAQRAAAGPMKLQDEEGRWGVEASQERKRAAAESADQPAKAVIPMPAPNERPRSGAAGTSGEKTK